MIAVEPFSFSLPAILMTGLAFGAGPCNVACLPYLGPVLLTRESDRRWRTVMPFFAGRMLGYTLLAAVAGAAGESLISASLLDGRGSLVLGIATAVLGLLVLWRSRKAVDSCPASLYPRERSRGSLRGVPLGLFGMGMGMALNPCLPLTSVLLAAAATAQAGAGALLGLTFGVGAVLIPLLLFGTLVTLLGSQIRIHAQRWKPVLERGAGILLIALGAVTALGWVRP